MEILFEPPKWPTCFFQTYFLSSFKSISQAAMDTVIEKGKAAPTMSGAMLNKKIIVPMHAALTHQPFSNIPEAIRN